MIVGLTGGMGCGKSTAARLFEALGFRRLDSDEIVRRDLLTLPDVIAAVRERFGDEVIAADGGVLRPALAARAFANDEAREWLENLLHPRLFARWRQEFRNPQVGAWIVEVPLLFEKQLENWFDFTVCVTATSQNQIARLEERGIPSALAVQRISKQLPLALKIELADFVLSNDGTVDFLRDQIAHLAVQLGRVR